MVWEMWDEKDRTEKVLSCAVSESASNQFDPLSRIDGVQVGIEPADVVDMDIEARGDTFEGVAFARGVGYFFNTGLGRGCLRQAEYLSFLDGVAFDVVGDNQVGYADVVAFGNVEQGVAFYNAVDAGMERGGFGFAVGSFGYARFQTCPAFAVGGNGMLRR